MAIFVDPCPQGSTNSSRANVPEPSHSDREV